MTYLTPKEAAERLKVSKDKLARLRIEGGGPAFSKLGHRTVRYLEEDLDAWAADQRKSSTGDSQ